MDDTDLIKELRMNIAERLEIPIWMISSPPFNYGLRFSNGSVMAEICWDIADCMRATHGYDNERVSDWAELVRYNHVTEQWDHVEADGNPGWDRSGAAVGTPKTSMAKEEFESYLGFDMYDYQWEWVRTRNANAGRKDQSAP